ncbi:hypothetical protein [Ruicaihuangia caeni]|uniref:hypothetical protein n=1 Tax=Ruicaihuangia caeni TaxID=3042517 RepID=UPI00338F00AD
MTWIRIDPAQALLVGVKMIDSALNGNAALDRLGALAGTPGLGAYAAAVESETLGARTRIARFNQDWIDQGTDMLARTNKLLADQRAASMVGTVGSVSAAIIGGLGTLGGAPTSFSPTVMGGFSSYTGSAMPSIASIVGGTTVGGTGPSFGSTTMSINSGAGSGPMALAAVVQKRQEAMRAKLDAASRAGAAGARTSNDLGVQAVVNSQTIKQYWNTIGRIDASQSLILAPSGSRINSSGSVSAGYQSVGSYGSVKIEAPIYRDKYGRGIP